jgi:acetylornithine deacetylase/succinyl-diaminopimelate desuccinylase-like protein
MVSRHDGVVEIKFSDQDLAQVVKVCQDLIAIDSRNWGLGEATGEAEAADYVANHLKSLGLNPIKLGPDSKRTSVLCEIKGKDSNAEKTIIHAHLDVVPFNEEEWAAHPLSAEIIDGAIYGRGAVDMKNGIAMVLTSLGVLLKNSWKPNGDIKLAFFADEEAGGILGSHWVVDNHPEFFTGAKYAVGEVGGFSTSLSDGVRLYLIETAQKGIAWMNLKAKGTAGHGSMINSDNAVLKISQAVERISNHEFPLTLHESVKHLLLETAEITKTDFDAKDPEKTADLLIGLSKIVKATLRDTANPTMLAAGYKANVIPSEASAVIDGRFLPGNQESFVETIKTLAGDQVEVSFQNLDVALNAPFSGSLIENMINAISIEDPAARVVPYMLSGGTDAKALSKLGVMGYGFMPLMLPRDLDFAALFHGKNERIPTQSLQFGLRAFCRFLAKI